MLKHETNRGLLVMTLIMTAPIWQMDECDSIQLRELIDPGYVDCVRLLLEKGASASASTDAGWTPTHCAAQTGKLTSLRALHVADGPIDLQDIYGDNPRRVSEIYGNQDCVNLLLQAELEAVERKKTEELENEINNSDDSVTRKTPVPP